MSSLKLTADSGGGTVEIKAPATTTSNGAKQLIVSPDGLIGITQADQWRITADLDSNSAILTSNWERCDTYYDKIGTGMSESSGVFTFPQTGIWLIMFNINCRYADYQRRYIGGHIQVTSNNSSYEVLTDAYNAFPSSSGQPAYASAALMGMFDVTNVSNDKVKFQVVADGSVTWLSATNINYNHVTFIRLGDT
jgi:hypothetical protein